MGGLQEVVRAMRHDEFAERVVRSLDKMAAPLEDRRGTSAVRANELRVAARVVRDLSEAVSREERGSSVGRLPAEVAS